MTPDSHTRRDENATASTTVRDGIIGGGFGTTESDGKNDVAAVDIDASSSDEYNIFRDSLLRYAGYANEVGESFRYQFPRLVVPSYVVSFGYCFADAACAGWKVYSDPSRRKSGVTGASSPAVSLSSSSSSDSSASTSPSNLSSTMARTLEATGRTAVSDDDDRTRRYNAYGETIRCTADTLLWQCLASVMIPGFTINLIVKASRFAVAAAAGGAGGGAATATTTAAASTTGTTTRALVTKWFPTAAGLGSVPIIVHPIDASVDYLLDNTTRTWWKKST